MDILHQDVTNRIKLNENTFSVGGDPNDEQKQTKEKETSWMKPLEGFITQDGMLSARNVVHRSDEVFNDFVKSSSFLLRQNTKNDQTSRCLRITFSRAYAFHRLKQYQKAKRDYTTCITNDKTWALPLFNRACLHYTLKNNEAAIKDLTEAIRLESDNATFLECRARILREMGKYEKATKDYLTIRNLPVEHNNTLALKSIEETSKATDGNQKIKGPDISHLWRVLHLPTFDRTSNDLKTASQCVRLMPYFTSVGEIIAIQMLKYGKLVSRNKGENIVTQGEAAHHFFIILSGSVSVIVDTNDEDGELISRVSVKTLYSGFSFGEPSVKQSQRFRTASLQCIEESKFLALDYYTYAKLVGHLQASNIQDKIKFLRCCSMFATCPETLLYRIAQAATTKMFEPGRNILKAGQTVKVLYLIRKGVCEAKKIVQIPIFNADQEMKHKYESWVVDNGEKLTRHQSSNKTFPSLGENENKIEDNDKNTIQKEITVATLASGEFIGESCVLIPNYVSQVTITTLTLVELYELSHGDLMTFNVRFNSGARSAMQDALLFHNPPPGKLIQFHLENEKWQIQKSKIVSEIMNERYQQAATGVTQRHGTRAKQKDRFPVISHSVNR